MPINRGAVTNGTRQNLISGLRAKPMPAAAVDATLAQVTGFAEQLVATYSVDIAVGEVGPAGSGVASADPILAEREPTVLMYGRVQSGKTAAMILTSALCLDNGFRAIIVLTSDNVALVAQTATRFRALNGPRVFAASSDENDGWLGQEDQIREDIATDGLVLVCPKNSFHLSHVIQFLQQIEAPSYPTLVFDDEADNATPDTTIAARAANKPNAPAYASTIHRRVIENQRPGEEGQSIGEMFVHSLYVQVTATPFILFLQEEASRIRPNVTFLLEPGAGYCGGEAFFGNFDPSIRTVAPSAPLVLVPDTEGQAITRSLTVPDGLSASISFFLVAATAKALADGWPTSGEGFKHLSHTSHRIDQHGIVVNHIDRYLAELRRQLRTNTAAAVAGLEQAYDELCRTGAVVNPPTLQAIVQDLPDSLRQTDVIRINSETDIRRFGPRLNFVVGGNILGRGLTIDDLIVTYYIREAQVSQMDTVWQHARMYGYRIPLMPYTRVYLPRRVAVRFRHIHEAEEALRDGLNVDARGEDVLIQTPPGMRATRLNALNNEVVRVISPGREQIHPWHVEQEQVSSAQILETLIGAGVPINGTERAARASAVPLATALALVNSVPIRDGDPGLWNPGLVSSLMNAFLNQYNGQCHVYVRGLEEAPPIQGWSRGRLGGPEITLIRRAAGNVPALALLYLGEEDAPSGWYPTLVLPGNTPRYIFNPT